jgi:hypothetical protein
VYDRALAATAWSAHGYSPADPETALLPPSPTGKTLRTYQPPAAALRTVHAQQVAEAVEVQHAVQQVVLGLKN